MESSVKDYSNQSFQKKFLIWLKRYNKKKKRIMKVYKNNLFAGLVKCKECDFHMTPCYTNKRKQGKLKRYYYYRFTKTLKKDWDDCEIKQVSANRLEDYVFQNLERIALDKPYIDSLIFRATAMPVGDCIGYPSTRSAHSGQVSHDSKYPMDLASSGDRIGLEPSVESPKISSEIFAQTLHHFLKGISQRKGLKVLSERYSERT